MGFYLNKEIYSLFSTYDIELENLSGGK